MSNENKENKETKPKEVNIIARVVPAKLEEFVHVRLPLQLKKDFYRAAAIAHSTPSDIMRELVAGYINNRS